MNRGIIYVIGGNSKYARWTLKSIISLRRNGGKSGQLPVHVHFIRKYAYEDIFNQLGCTCILHESNEVSHHVHRKFKSYIMENSIPFDQYIMLDADTFIQSDFFELFNQIPENGVVGIEDGNFESHLQMAELLFLRKGQDQSRERVHEMLGVDYGLNENFPPYFNVGVIGFSAVASKVVGNKLFPLLSQLRQNDFYNPHDEQLPMNAIIYKEKIKSVSASPIYNYTRSRLVKNTISGIHDKMKNDICVIHNKNYPKEATWIDIEPINLVYENLLHKGKKSS